MNRSTTVTSTTTTQRQLVGMPAPFMESSIDLGRVVTEAVMDLLKLELQGTTSAAHLALAHLGRVLTPGDASDLIWQWPVEYKLQAERWVNAMGESFSVVSRAQRQVFELQGVALSQRAEEASKAMLKMNAVVASRRATAEVIDFAERRAG